MAHGNHVQLSAYPPLNRAQVRSPNPFEQRPHRQQTPRKHATSIGCSVLGNRAAESEQAAEQVVLGLRRILAHVGVRRAGVNLASPDQGNEANQTSLLRERRRLKTGHSVIVKHPDRRSRTAGTTSDKSPEDEQITLLKACGFVAMLHGDQGAQNRRFYLFRPSNGVKGWLRGGWQSGGITANLFLEDRCFTRSIDNHTITHRQRILMQR